MHLQEFQIEGDHLDILGHLDKNQLGNSCKAPVLRVDADNLDHVDKILDHTMDNHGF